MKNIFILITALLTGQGIYAMQPKKELTQRERELLGGDLWVMIDNVMSRPHDVKSRQRIDELIAQDAVADYYEDNTNMGETALILAVRSGELGLVEKLIRAGANPNFYGKDLITSPLYEAVTSEVPNVNIVDALIKAGANVNAPGYDDRLPWLSTCDPVIFKKLVDAGANLFLVNPDGGTAMQRAALIDLDSVQIILNKLTLLGTDEKVAVRGWLYANKALQKEGKVYLFKDSKALVAKDIIGLAVPALLRDRVVRAGGERALEMVRYLEEPEMLHLLEKYLDLTFLKQRALEQVGPIK